MSVLFGSLIPTFYSMFVNDCFCIVHCILSSSLVYTCISPSTLLLKKRGASLSLFLSLPPSYPPSLPLSPQDIYLHNPSVHWDDIIGLDSAKRLVKEAVVYPIKYPQLFTGILSPWKGLLLYGPPGSYMIFF